MRVVIDLQACQSGSRFGGIGRYSMDLLKSMISVGQDVEFIVLLNQLFPQTANEVRSLLRNMIDPSSFVSFPAPRGCASAHQNRALTHAAEVLRENFIASLVPDVVHVASLVEGFHEDVVTSIGRSNSTPPTAVTFYDLIPLIEKENYLSSRVTRTHYFEKIRSLSQADALLAISEFVACEGLRLLPDFRGMMVTIGGGIGSEFRESPPNPHTVEVRRKFGLSRKFVLYVASFDQRKNQANLIRAFAENKGTFRGEYQLALAGGGDPQVFTQLESIAAECGLAADDLKLLGRVTDRELITLYSSCSLFVFPPLSEGLGMPPLEAAACGAVVIGSATSSIPEVIGWENALFNPHNPSSIAAKMREALLDQSFRAESRRLAPAQIAKYNWARSATTALDALKKIAVRSTPTPVRVNSDQDLIENSFCEDLVEPDLFEVSRCAVIIGAQEQSPWRRLPAKVGWVSSWGARCGIADYSMHLIQHYEVKPIVFASYRGTVNPSEDTTVIRCWEEGKGDYLVELETAINKHEIDIVHIQFNFGFFDFESFRRFVFSLTGTGKSIFVTLHSTLDQFEEPTWRLSWIANALKICSRIFVHSVHDVQRLSELGISETVTLIPLGLVQYSSTMDHSTNSAVTIATYGFALPGKGLEEAVEAVSILKKEGINVRLKMMNADYQDSSGISSSTILKIKQKIDEYGLDELVTTNFDFNGEEQVYSSLSEADIILFPYTKTGESGSAAVRAAMSLNKIVAITPLPIFDDIRDAAFLLPGVTPKEIASGLSALISNIDADSEDIKKLSLSRQLLTRVTSYRQVSKFLQEEMGKYSYLSTYTEVFKSKKGNLFISNGSWSGDYLLAADSGGIVCYGPYIDLWKGVYRLTLDGDASSDAIAIRFIIASHGNRIVSVDVPAFEGQIRGDFLFVIEENLPLVEVVIEAPRKSAFRLHQYSLLKRWT